MSNKLGKNLTQILSEQEKKAISEDKNEKYTPAKYIEAARSVLHEIDLDPFSCEFANAYYVKAKKIFTKKHSAHDNKWIVDKGGVFMNPPYSDGLYKPSVKLFLKQLRKLKFEAITLTNNNTETEPTQELMKVASAYCFPDHRINYYTINGPTNSNRFAQIFCYFGENVGLFREHFEQFGVTMISPYYLKKIVLNF